MNDVLEKETNELQLIEDNNIINEETIKSKIYEIRGVQVMLDSDLAALYNVETKRINEAVKNNPNKFPERFSWKLTNEESKIFLVENFDQKIETRGGKYKNPRVFTEHGVLMLATILKSSIAIEVSVKIMDAFVAMRHFIIDNKDYLLSINNINNRLLNYENLLINTTNNTNNLLTNFNKRITNNEEKLREYDNKFSEIFSKFNKKQEIYFKKGNTFSSYSTFVDTIKLAKTELIVIDPYADITLLNLIKYASCKVIIIAKDSKRLDKVEIDKYNQEYQNLTVIRNNEIHDRFFILDRAKIYHIGTSINYAGNSSFIFIELVNDKKDILVDIERIINEKNKNKMSWVFDL